MFEKEAEEYFETECLHSYADTEEQLKEDVVPAFQKGAEFGYNKAKKEMQAQIEKMKCCYNCQKDCGPIVRRICFDNSFKDWELRR